MGPLGVGSPRPGPRSSLSPGRLRTACVWGLPQQDPLGVLSSTLSRHPQTFPCPRHPRAAGRCFARVGERPAAPCPSLALMGLVLAGPRPWGLSFAGAPGSPQLWALSLFVGWGLWDSAALLSRGIPTASSGGSSAGRWGPCPPYRPCPPLLAHLWPSMSGRSSSSLPPGHFCPLPSQLTPGCPGCLPPASQAPV